MQVYFTPVGGGGNWYSNVSQGSWEMIGGTSLGTATLGASLGHLAYLVVLAAAGLLAGQYTYRRRLYV